MVIFRGDLMVFWAVLTPLVIFLVIVPGYVVVTYLKHRLTKEKPGNRLLNKDRVSAYYTAIRPILRDRLQRRSSLNVPKPHTGKTTSTKHLRSASMATSKQLPQPQIKSLLQTSLRHNSRRNSSPISILVTPQHKPDIMETYSLYQIQPHGGVFITDDDSPETNSLKSGYEKKTFDTNNNGKNLKKSRHLVASSPIHFYSATPFIIPKKLEPLRECMKLDLPEKTNKS